MTCSICLTSDDVTICPNKGCEICEDCYKESQNRDVNFPKCMGCGFVEWTHLSLNTAGFKDKELIDSIMRSVYYRHAQKQVLEVTQDLSQPEILKKRQDLLLSILTREQVEELISIIGQHINLSEINLGLLLHMLNGVCYFVPSVSKEMMLKAHKYLYPLHLSAGITSVEYLHNLNVKNTLLVLYFLLCCTHQGFNRHPRATYHRNLSIYFVTASHYLPAEILEHDTYKIIQKIMPSAREYFGKNHTFVAKCSNCMGRVNDEWVCVTCAQSYCPECEEPKGVEHKCDPNMLESVAALKSTTKQCPKCKVRIMRTEGCPEMWCTNCHVNFNYITGKLIERKNVENPEHTEYMHNKQSVDRSVVEEYEKLKIPKSLTAYHDDFVWLQKIMLLNTLGKITHDTILKHHYGLMSDDKFNEYVREQFYKNEIREEYNRICGQYMMHIAQTFMLICENPQHINEHAWKFDDYYVRHYHKKIAQLISTYGCTYKSHKHRLYTIIV